MSRSKYHSHKKRPRYTSEVDPNYACPACDSSSLESRGENVYRCDNCGMYIEESDP